MEAPIMLSIGICVSILVMEALFWLLFRRKVGGICFGSDRGEGWFGMLTIPHLQIFAVLHAVVLCITVVFLLLLQW